MLCFSHRQSPAVRPARLACVAATAVLVLSAAVGALAGSAHGHKPRPIHEELGGHHAGHGSHGSHGDHNQDELIDYYVSKTGSKDATLKKKAGP